MWSNEVPKHADLFQCHVGNCQYQSKYRYNFLFHLAGKHKQLKEKLSRDGISLDVLVPIEVDEVDEEALKTENREMRKDIYALQAEVAKLETEVNLLNSSNIPYCIVGRIDRGKFMNE